MKNSLAETDQSSVKSTWIKLCLHLLAALLLILTPILLARAQKPDTTQQPAAGTNAETPARQAGEDQNKEQGNVNEVQPEDEGILSSVFSGSSLGMIVVLGVVALMVIHKFRSSSTVDVENELKALPEKRANSVDSVDSADDKQKSRERVLKNRSVLSTGEGRDRTAAVRQPANAPVSLYGPYRIDQEVGKLVLGQAHRMDVLSSRASEDRQAIQASLIKTVRSTERSDEERQRAREALEEYGFVARESAALLLAKDTFERTSAARLLGEIGSAAALPFLLEALYDSESIVRNQAVVSIGELKVPSAIGALLDLARKHPDVPSTLVSRALSACSVEGLGFDGATLPATSFLTADGSTTFDFTLEQRSTVEELPDTIEDERLAYALNQVLSAHFAERAEGIKNLAQYPAKNAVAALVAIAQKDPEANNRALAVTSLAFIDHESVFPAILTGMADESREVRAAAARALSHLSFDRSDAYVTLIRTADFELLHTVAQACIKAGIISQNLDRLANNDRRQAYEAFALICLLAKVKMTDPIIDAIKQHAKQTVRLSVVHLLASTGDEYVFEQLQQLAQQHNMEEEVKTAVLEALYKLEHSRVQGETQKNQDSSVGFDSAATETEVDEIGK